MTEEQNRFVLVSLERIKTGVMFWRPNRLGYTNALTEAGLYSIAEFGEINRQSPGDSIAVPFDVAVAIAAHAASAIPSVAELTGQMRTAKDRETVNESRTHIYVRAIGQDGRYGSYDIAELDQNSLMLWLLSRGGRNPLAERTVCILLGHRVDWT